MPARTLAIPVAFALLLAGCITLDASDLDDVEVELPGLTASTTPLWHNPQNFPHPAFNFPTLTNPAAGLAEGVEVPAWWNPIPPAELPATISGVKLHADTVGMVPSGGGIALFGSLALVPGWNTATHIVDISDPAAPRVLSSFDARTRGADTIAYPDGRLVGVFSTSGGVLVYDLTDPTDPQELPALEPEHRGHKVAVVPGTPIVYNANSRGGGNAIESRDASTATGQIEIFDLTDPENPVLVQNFKNGYGCHHIYFYIDAENDRYRALCAGIEATQIIDVADPRNPEVLVTIPFPHGSSIAPSLGVASPAALSHFAILNQDATILIVGDESGGGLAPACDAYLDTPLGTASGPLGNLYFYDVTDETNPVLKGWISPTHHYTTNPPTQDQGGFGYAGCTAHHGRLVPDPEGRDLLAMAFYGAGVVLIDFSDPTSPRIIEQWNDNTNTWEVHYYNGYLFTGDMSRGFDVFTFR